MQCEFHIGFDCNHWKVERTPLTHTVILGAGVAGLCAGYELQQNGYDVILLEARPFAGGRVQTIRHPFDDGLHAEAGATIVPDSHHITHKYLQHFDIALDRDTEAPGKSVYVVNGRRLVGEEAASRLMSDLKDDERNLTPALLLKKYLTKGDFVATPEVEHLTFADYLRKRGASEAAIAIIRVEYVEEWGEGIDSYSAVSGLHDLKFGHVPPFARIREGSDMLPHAFVSRLKNIVYQAEIREIHQNANGVRIQFERRNEMQSVDADYAVCTIPFSVLRDISFYPAISEQHHALIKTLPYTSVTRVYMQMKQRFWEEQGLSGNAYTDLPVASVFHSSFHQPGTRGILESYTSGPKARDMGALSESERIHFTLRQTEKIFQGAGNNYERGVSKFWDEDRFARGGYSWFPPGERQNILAIAPRIEGRIHFAGDHTSELPGWMQGALSSGLRAASEIIKKTTDEHR